MHRAKIKIFKFGGASVKDAEAVRNMGRILEESQGTPLAVVISAMGKTTNALEDLLEAAFRKTHHKRLEELYTYHQAIAYDLLGQANCGFLEELFQELAKELQQVDQNLTYGRQYDAVISYGEIISTQIVSHYLQKSGLPTLWADARKLIVTNGQWQEALVDWGLTRKNIISFFEQNQSYSMIVTQGFIGANSEGATTTLGREGSDYTAAILGNCLHADSVTIWKDVPGVLNADPKRVSNTTLYRQLPYQEAAEMAYYGASVIHPKTIKPLANKNIPLFVKSFLNPKEDGTCIGDFKVEKLPPAIIFKGSQTVVKFEARDLSNIGQRYLSQIIDALSDLHITINLMMNTAVSFSICMNTDERKLQAVREQLSAVFEVSNQDYLELVTIKHPDEFTLQQFYKSADALLSLRTATSFQFVHIKRF